MTVLEVLLILFILIAAVTLWLGAPADAVTRELRARRKACCQSNGDCHRAEGKRP